ncbi:CHRD domain-containing protein [Paradevosia shaoguanensis]|uniref:CHRD domain-containing protein n=1 Tax=Paradevosia shaoguanensis TaxID=1335043 RepID=A0AA41QQY0_9HYPH|nr:CHRD domain-containing protein [Paradevosia shaoguanensis]KFL25197.1 CHRD domain-containing protein [Devosia sp. 17-2-E-8]MCF1744450.1 CHRD domain-containing protein [Paradevosia shaoguanensis]MCI0128933.1 CHRD domain-containing protein [Paradevosia shaoguanensis]CDP52918.1 hypothetical protein [Devosia sp. DBB001]
MSISVRPLIVATTLAFALAATPAFAEMVHFKAALDGKSEVPPTDSAGTGTVDATYDTDSKAFTWTIDYSGLSGDASAAHFHGPADPGANASPVVPIDGALTSPIKGTATLTDEQATDLQAGKWYFNIHTAKFPDGEIRGQVTKADM